MHEGNGLSEQQFAAPSSKMSLQRFSASAAFICLFTVLSLQPVHIKPASAQAAAPVKANIIDRAHFFKQFRSQFYRIKDKEKYLIDRYERVFDYWDSKPHLKDLRWLSYILATTYHETGRKIKAVRECFGKNDAASIACVTRLHRRGRIKRNYAKIDKKTGKAYFGRGHVQLTWDYNYKRMGKELGLKDGVYKNPDLALHPDTSVAIMAEGMIKGLFTGKRLSQYFNGTSTNWGGARRIVNGLDKYKTIGSYGRKFYATLRTIPSGAPVADSCDAKNVPQSCLTKLNSRLAVMNDNYDALDQNYKNSLKDVVDLKAIITDLKTRIATLEAEGPSSDALINLQAKYTSLENRLTVAEQSNEEKAAENTRLTALNNDLQTKLDDAITDGANGNDGKLLKARLDQVEYQFQTLNTKLAAVEQTQKRLDALSTSLADKQTTINAQLTDIEISKDALQTRERNFLSDTTLLDNREQDINETQLKLDATEARLQRFENDLSAEKKAFEDLKSRSWYKRAWDNVSSTWRKE